MFLILFTSFLLNGKTKKIRLILWNNKKHQSINKGLPALKPLVQNIKLYPNNLS